MCPSTKVEQCSFNLATTFSLSVLSHFPLFPSHLMHHQILSFAFLPFKISVFHFLYCHKFPLSLSLIFPLLILSYNPMHHQNPSFTLSHSRFKHPLILFHPSTLTPLSLSFKIQTYFLTININSSLPLSKSSF